MPDSSSVDPYDYWHRRLSSTSDWLVLSGDLDPVRSRAEAQIRQWRRAGITSILDLRIEWTDEDLVREIAPELSYWHVGADDDGNPRDDAWFDAGLGAWRDAMTNPHARVLVHCHMGINRGPSMGFRLMLAKGDAPLAALDAIRRSRPIAGLAYAADALDHHHRSVGTRPAVRERELEQLATWMRSQGIDLDTVVRRLRTRIS